MDDQQCIICLVADNTIQFKGSCKCSPRIHVGCLDTWFKTNNNSCPICRLQYVTPTYVEESSSDGIYCCLSVSTCIVMVMVFIFI
jgi:hypothetical protein